LKSVEGSGGPKGGLCLKCHYSCKTCKKDQVNCSSCYDDSELHRTGRCHAKELVQEVVELEKWYTAVTVVFLCLCFVLVILVIYIITEKNPQMLCCWMKTSNTTRRRRSYDGLPLKRERMNLNLASKRPSAPTYRDDLSEDDL
jgi:hypothetical protein